MTSAKGEFPFKMDTVVRHQAFGVGVITVLEPGPGFVTVDFDRGIVKRLSLEIAQRVLSSLADDGITALGARDSNLVAGWTRDAPLKMLRAALIEKGGRATPSEIAPLIAPYLRGLSWDAWWRRTRTLLEPSGGFEIRPDGTIQAITDPRQEALSSPELPRAGRKADPEPLSTEATASLSSRLLRRELNTRDLPANHLDQVLQSFEGIEPTLWVDDVALSLELVDDIRAFRRLMAASEHDANRLRIPATLINAVTSRLRNGGQDRSEKEKWLLPRARLIRAYHEKLVRSLPPTMDQSVVGLLGRTLGNLWVTASQQVGPGPSVTTLRDALHQVCLSWSDSRSGLVELAVENSPIYEEAIDLLVSVLSALELHDQAALLWDTAVRQPRVASIVLRSLQAKANVDALAIITAAIDRGLDQHLGTTGEAMTLLADGLIQQPEEKRTWTETAAALSASFKAALASRNPSNAWHVWSEQQLIAWTSAAQRTSRSVGPDGSERSAGWLQPILGALTAAANSNKATVQRLRSDYEKRIRELEIALDGERAKSSEAITVAKELSSHVRRIETTQKFEGILAALGEITSSMRGLQLEKRHLGAEDAWKLFEARFRTSFIRLGATSFLDVGEECDYDLEAHEIVPGLSIGEGTKVRVVASGVRLPAPDGGQVVLRKPLVEPLSN